MVGDRVRCPPPFFSMVKGKNRVTSFWFGSQLLLVKVSVFPLSATSGSCARIMGAMMYGYEVLVSC